MLARLCSMSMEVTSILQLRAGTRPFLPLSNRAPFHGTRHRARHPSSRFRTYRSAEYMSPLQQRMQQQCGSHTTMQVTNTARCGCNSSTIRFLGTASTPRQYRHSRVTSSSLTNAHRHQRQAVVAYATKSSDRPKSRYECTSCGARHLQWYGKCPTCSKYNTLQEIIVEPEPTGGGLGVAAARKVLADTSIRTTSMSVPQRTKRNRQKQQRIPFEVAVPAGQQISADEDPANYTFPDYEAMSSMDDDDGADDGEDDGYDESEDHHDIADVDGGAAQQRLQQASGNGNSTFTAMQRGWVQTSDVPERLSDIQRTAAELRIPLVGPTGAAAVWGPFQQQAIGDQINIVLKETVVKGDCVFYRMLHFTRCHHLWSICILAHSGN